MKPNQAIDYAERLLYREGYKTPTALGLDTFEEYSNFVAAAVRDLTEKQKAKYPQLKEFAIAWKRLRDNWDRLVEADPMVQYRPAHSVAYDFHSSPAFIRWFRTGNRCGKTQTGYAEHYFVLTGQHRWRYVPPGNTFIVGLAYSKYAGNVFEKKMVVGEEDNDLSPMFPEGGKWFHHYDPRKYRLTIACPRCAEAGEALNCRHRSQQWSIQLFSDEGGWEVLQGAQYRLGHFDEHIDVGFYQEAMQRLGSVDYSSLLITGTPLYGLNAWEIEKFGPYIDGREPNLCNPNDEKSPPFVSLHTISQWDAKILSEEAIYRSMQTMDEFEIEARVYGRPAPLTDNPVFDRVALSEIREQCAADPELVDIRSNKILEEVVSADDLDVHQVQPARPLEWTGIRMWERPKPGHQYIAAVDTAKGVVKGDASCCSVLEMINEGGRLRLRLVAQYHGWINAFDYADEVFKLAVLYNDATVVVELTGGFGEAVVLRLRQLAYWNIYRDTTNHARVDPADDSRFGVDTSAASKPFMVAALQQMVRERLIEIPCRATIQEMVAYEQKNTNKDGARLLTPRFQGAGGSHDDRVMSLVIGVSVAVSGRVFTFVDAGSDMVESGRITRDSRPYNEPEPFDYMGPAAAELEDS